MHRWLTVFLLGLALAVSPAAAAGPYLIADLNTDRLPASGLPPSATGSGVELGDVLYFAADDGRHGSELWRTDGTTAGTRMVADVCPGPCSSWPGRLILLGDRLAFDARDGVHGTEMWITDGTRAGTRMPRDLCPGACSSISYGWTDPVVIGDRLFFVTRASGEYRVGLAVTDGTAAGTRQLVDGDQPILPLGEIDGRLAFAGPGAAWYSALWWTDGTPEGTVQAFDLCSGSSCGLTWLDAGMVDGRIVFFGDGRIWVSDGTSGGTRTIGTSPPPGSRWDMVVWNGALVYATVEGLWRSDGTPEGTRRLRSFDLAGRARSLLPFGDEVLFIAGHGQERLALWRTQGTPETTRVVWASSSPGSDLGPLIRAGGRAVFPVVDGDGASSALWETDGSTAGTRLLAPLCGPAGRSCSPGRAAPYAVAALGSQVLFGLEDPTLGGELWKAGSAGVSLVRDIGQDPGSSRISHPVLSQPGETRARDLAALGNRLIFAARKSGGERATLWASPGTAAGTAEIGPGVPWPNGLVQIGDRLWLRGADDFVSWPYLWGHGLWSTDGTAAGTVEASRDLAVTSLPGGTPELILFAASDLPLPELGGELWTASAPPGSPSLLRDLAPNVLVPNQFGEELLASSSPALFEPLGNLVIFAADDGTAGREPWGTDGTAAGTRLLADIHQGVLPQPDFFSGSTNAHSLPGPFVRLGARAYFAADDGTAGRELWATDGTPAGTVRVRDLRPGPASSNPRDLVGAGNSLFFLADDGASDALWTISSEGQATRVRLLGNRRRASSLVAVGSRLFFVVDGPATGLELWTSDGTRRGTHLAREIRPGGLGSYPQELTAVDGLLLFAADDGVHGLEPWVSDGTAAGTRLLADLAPGVDASGPANFTVAGDLVGFDADDGVHGREMWAVRKADLR